MQSEYARQTRWANAPEPVDPDRTPPGARYVKQVVWLPCNDCDLQVHIPVVQLLTDGVACPECGRHLAAPEAPGDTHGALTRVLDSEEHFRQELAREETPCCD